MLKTDRNFWLYFLLSGITLGIYPLLVLCGISNDINIIANRHDGKKTMHWALMCFVVGPLTLGIGYLVWFNNICGRIGSELARRNSRVTFGAGDFWIWNVLLSFTVICPFVFMYRFFNAMNALAADYNVNG